MSTIITVRLNENDHFWVTDPDTGIMHEYNSILFHSPCFIVTNSILSFFYEEFPGKTECNCSADALKRMQSIVDFNCINDEVRF